MICPHCGHAISWNIPPDKKLEVIALGKQGYSVRDVQTLTGVSFASVARILRADKGVKSKRKRKQPNKDQP